jgi:hypothetical protein
MTSPAGGIPVERRAEQLKERIYVTFTSLAVVLALSSHAEEASPRSAATTLIITVGGTLLAVFVADLVAHITVHAAVPDADELRHMLEVSVGSLGVVVLPLIFIGLAGAGVWRIEGSLRASTIALAASLVVIGYLAARRVRLPLRQRLVILFAEFGLGVVVVLLELLAHG